MSQHKDSGIRSTMNAFRKFMTSPVEELIGKGVIRARRIIGAATITTLAVVGVATVSLASASKDMFVQVDGVSVPVTVVKGDTLASLRDAGVPVDHTAAVSSITSDSQNQVVVTSARPVTIVSDDKVDRTWTNAPSAVDAVKQTVKQEPGSVEIALPRESDTTIPVDTKSTEVKLVHDGKEQVVQVPAGLPADKILSENEIKVGPLDRVSMTVGEDGMPVVKVVRVKRQMVETETVVPHKTEEVSNPHMMKGDKKVTTNGSDGLVKETKFVTTEDGVETFSAVVSSEQVSAPVNEVVEVGTMDMPSGTANPSGNKAIGKELMLAAGFGEDQWGCLEQLWDHESHWNQNSHNSSSGAHGIPQALPGSKMASAGADWATNPATQIKWGLGYISGRYGTPCGAWGHFQSMGWY